MKQTLWALVAVLGLAFIGLLPSEAQAQTYSCLQTAATGYTTSPLYICTGVTIDDKNSAVNATAAVHADAMSKMQSGTHHLVVFDTYAHYLANCAALGTVMPCYTDTRRPIPSTAEGFTWNPDSTHWYSALWIDRMSKSKSDHHTEAAVAHEVGHHTDNFYSAIYTGAGSASELIAFGGTMLTGAQFVVGGLTPHAGDALVLTLHILNQSNRTYTNLTPITYAVVAGSTKELAADYFVNYINTHYSGTPYLITAAISSKDKATFNVKSQTILRYQWTKSGTGSFYWSNVYDHDWSQFINASSYGGGDGSHSAVAQCNSSGSGIFNFYQDSAASPAYICSGTTGGGATLSTAYAGLDNGQILLKAWPYFYSSDSDYGIPRWGELWAEANAAATRNTQNPPLSPDAPFSGYFTCIVAAIGLTTTDPITPPATKGAPPTDDNLPSQCYSQ